MKNRQKVVVNVLHLKNKNRVVQMVVNVFQKIQSLHLIKNLIHREKDHRADQVNQKKDQNLKKNLQKIIKNRIIHLNTDQNLRNVVVRIIKALKAQKVRKKVVTQKKNLMKPRHHQQLQNHVIMMKKSVNQRIIMKKTMI